MVIEISRQIFETTQISDIMKIRRIGSEVFYTNRQTDRQTEGKRDGQIDITKLIVGFRYFLIRLKAMTESCSKHFPCSILTKISKSPMLVVPVYKQLVTMKMWLGKATIFTVKQLFCWLQVATSVFKQEVPPYTTERTLNLVCVVKPNRCTNVSNLFYFGMTLYMFRAVFPSIVRNSRLYIQQQAFVKQILLSAG